MSLARTARVVEKLRERIAHLEGSTRRRAVILPFGVPEIDSALPAGGLSFGALHEFAGGGTDTVNGAAAAQMVAGIAARTQGKDFVVPDQARSSRLPAATVSKASSPRIETVPIGLDARAIGGRSNVSRATVS